MINCNSVKVKKQRAPACVATLAMLISLALPTSTSATDKNHHETDGMVVVEAEHFASQHKDSKRRWFIATKGASPSPYADPDLPHYENASGDAYIEILPDTRTNHFEALVRQENFSNVPGQVAILSYPVHFETTGLYFVWARAYSSGSEDNGVHFGLNGTWPESAQRLQLCDGKHQWTWSSAQRVNTNHCGEPNTVTLEISAPGVHNIMLSMREDGFELDKFILTTDKEFVPLGIEAQETLSTQPELPKKEQLLEINEYSRIFFAASDFAASTTNKVSLYPLAKYDALAINTANAKDQNTFAYAQVQIDRRDAGTRKLTLVALGQPDAISRFKVLLNNTEIARFTAEKTNQRMQELYFEVDKVALKKGDVITVAAMAVTDSQQAENESPSVGGLWRALVLSRTN
ncbi:hypothetical protein [Glaciecola sp. SC05]|uniref:hypothetical protein n=1 Tax=Glaciecola sp. SC05 TaxID=1987355 RepID=UPI0035275E5C